MGADPTPRREALLLRRERWAAERLVRGVSGAGYTLAAALAFVSFMFFLQPHQVDPELPIGFGVGGLIAGFGARRLQLLRPEGRWVATMVGAGLLIVWLKWWLEWAHHEYGLAPQLWWGCLMCVPAVITLYACWRPAAWMVFTRDYRERVVPETRARYRPGMAEAVGFCCAFVWPFLLVALMAGS